MLVAQERLVQLKNEINTGREGLKQLQESFDLLQEELEQAMAQIQIEERTIAYNSRRTVLFTSYSAAKGINPVSSMSAIFLKRQQTKE